MFAPDYFAPRYFAPTYFPNKGRAVLPTIYATRRGLVLDHLELWTDIECNGGRLLAPIAHLLSLTETVNVSGEHTLAFSVPLDHPIVRLHDTPANDSNLRVDQVVRLILTDGSWTEHRISESVRQNRKGARTRSVIVRSILQDLGYRGLAVRATADGKTTPNFPALSLTMEQHIRSYILPALQAGGQAFWEIGELPHAFPVDMTYDRWSPLAALRALMIEGARALGGGALEMYVHGDATGYRIFIVEQIGRGLTPLRLRARRNLLDLTYAERGDDQANRISAYGTPVEDQRPSLGLAEWDVVSTAAVTEGYDFRLADPAGGEGPIKYDNQFLPPAGPAFLDDPDTEEEEVVSAYHLQFMTDGDWVAPIIATFAATQTVRCQSATAPPPGLLGPTLTYPPTNIPSVPSVPRRVRIVADADGRENQYVERADLIASETGPAYGVRVGSIDRPDIPGTHNLVPNPLGRIWPTESLLPTGWIRDNFNTFPESTEVIRETSSRYWEHGGHAVRAIFPRQTEGRIFNITAPVASIPHHAQGYLSIFARVTTIRGRIQVAASIWRGPYDFGGSITPRLPYISEDVNWGYELPESSGLLIGETDTNGLPIRLPESTNITLNTAEDIGYAAAWDLNKYPLYRGGFVQLYIAPATPADGVTGDATTDIECIIHGFQVTISHQQLPLIEGSGGVRLHQAANARLGLYSTPAPIVSVSALDLSGLRDYTPLAPGRPVIIEDPDSELAFASTRLMGWTKDHFNRAVPDLELSNERRDVVGLLAHRARSVRPQTTLVPQGGRGRSYSA